MATRNGSSVVWAGWLLFAAVMLIVIGVFNVIDGLVALFNDEVYQVTEDGLIVWDFTAWGIIHLILGGVLILAGLGLVARSQLARWVAIVAAGLNAIAQIAFIPAFPLWSILIIALDVVIIYALAARWQEAELN
jgi:hypothetical protein